MEAVEGAGSGVKWFVMDMIPVTMVDATGVFALRNVVKELRNRGVRFVAAGNDGMDEVGGTAGDEDGGVGRGGISDVTGGGE